MAPPACSRWHRRTRADRPRCDAWHRACGSRRDIAFAGYNIAQGKLSTQMQYHVENRKLDAKHHIVVDQLEFGDATESKQAVPLPIKLAVSLLKDRNGVITLDLPVG